MHFGLCPFLPPSLSSHISHSSLSSTMAKAPLPPTPVLALLPSNWVIVLTAKNNIALCILQGMMLIRAHIPPTRKWANLECLLFELDPPAHCPFQGCFRHWADSQCYKKRGTKNTMQGIGRRTTKQEEGDKGHNTRQSGNGGGGWG
jgi:hypothetical protein